MSKIDDPSLTQLNDVQDTDVAFGYRPSDSAPANRWTFATLKAWVKSFLGAAAQSALSDATPSAPGTPTPGVSTDVSRADHVHALPTPDQIGAATTGQLAAEAARATAAEAALDAAKADKTLTLTAGTGLTGGGNLSANRTLALTAASLASLALADSAVQGWGDLPGATAGGTAGRLTGLEMSDPANPDDTYTDVSWTSAGGWNFESDLTTSGSFNGDQVNVSAVKVGSYGIQKANGDVILYTDVETDTELHVAYAYATGMLQSALVSTPNIAFDSGIGLESPFTGVPDDAILTFRGADSGSAGAVDFLPIVWMGRGLSVRGQDTDLSDTLLVEPSKITVQNQDAGEHYSELGDDYLWFKGDTLDGPVLSGIQFNPDTAYNDGNVITNYTPLSSGTLLNSNDVSVTSFPGASPQGDGDGYIDASWLNLTDVELTFRHGTDAERLTTVFAVGEPVWTTDTEQLFVGDGTTAGGKPVFPYGAFLGEDENGFYANAGADASEGQAVHFGDRMMFKQWSIFDTSEANLNLFDGAGRSLTISSVGSGLGTPGITNDGDENSSFIGFDDNQVFIGMASSGLYAVNVTPSQTEIFGDLIVTNTDFTYSSYYSADRITQDGYTMFLWGEGFMSVESHMLLDDAVNIQFTGSGGPSTQFWSDSSTASGLRIIDTNSNSGLAPRLDGDEDYRDGYWLFLEEKASTGDYATAYRRLVANTTDNNLKLYVDGGWRTLATW